MPQVILIPFTTTEAAEFGSAWAFAGTPVAALRLVGDGNHATSTISLGQNDSNPLRGTLWRPASGVAFPWANKTITNVVVQMNVNNQGPEASAYFAVVSANEPLTYAEQVFNGEIALGVGVPDWVSLVYGNHANVKAAILADNYLLSITHYNHIASFHTVALDAARIVVDYVDNVPRGGIMPMEC